LESIASENSSKRLIGYAGARDRDPTPQSSPDLRLNSSSSLTVVEFAVDQSIDAAQEKARHRCDAN